MTLKKIGKQTGTKTSHYRVGLRLLICFLSSNSFFIERGNGRTDSVIMAVLFLEDLGLFLCFYNSLLTESSLSLCLVVWGNPHLNGRLRGEILVVLDIDKLFL